MDGHLLGIWKNGATSKQKPMIINHEEKKISTSKRI